uniref:Eukaryotic translation initiation factor 2A n=1 Tax=Ditylenchus dipsaci TaxID=166011 RepID=A0A915EHV2_9BILA
MFYGYYSSETYFGNIIKYHVPIAYFCVNLFLLAFCLFIILKKMTSNTRKSKLSGGKQEQYVFTWKAVTGWDYNIGNSETSSSLFKANVIKMREATAEYNKKIKQKWTWLKFFTRLVVNFVILCMFAMSVVAIYQVAQITEKDTFIKQNAVSITVALITLLFPPIFGWVLVTEQIINDYLELILKLEGYRPRTALRTHLFRVLFFYLINYFTLVYSLFIMLKTLEIEMLDNEATVSSCRHLRKGRVKDLAKWYRVTIANHPASFIYYSDVPSTTPAQPILHGPLSFNNPKLLWVQHLRKSGKRASLYLTLMWNSKGTAVLATATVEVDKSDRVSHLYILTTKGETIQVPLDKTGPLHDVKWSPSGNQFVVCYGFMPSKVAVYNVRGDTVWQHGEAHRNEVYYNPFGTILAICSFGNISSGKIEFWNVETKQKINTFEVPSTTAFEWAPDGNHFITATTAPRLRIANGEKKEELWQVCWKPSKAYSKTEIVTLTSAQQEAIANNVIVSNNRHPVDSLKQGAIKKEAYVPPYMRKPEANKPAYVSTKPPLSEHEKKLKSLEKKLEDISKLKEKKASGVTLELNQEEKIKNEHTLLEEIQQLRVSLAS